LDQNTPQADPQSQEPQSSQRQAPILNTTNLRTNVVYGDEMQLPKPDNTTRLISLNANGFRQTNDFQDILEIEQAMKVSSGDLLHFQETNTNWRSSCLAQC
jgi:hypothetical protein